MVGGKAIPRQEVGGIIPVQLRRAPAARFPTYNKVREPAARQQQLQSQEHASQVQDVPQTVRGIRKSATLHHCEATGGLQGDGQATEERSLGELFRE
jgi:hypothetical protein